MLSLKYSCRCTRCRKTRCLGSQSLKFVALSLVAKAYVRCRKAKILSRAQLWIWGFVYFINGVKFQRNNAYHRFKILVFLFDLRFRIKILIFPICQLYFFVFAPKLMPLFGQELLDTYCFSVQKKKRFKINKNFLEMFS